MYHIKLLMRKYKLEIIYMLILVTVLLSNQSSRQFMLLIKGLMILCMWMMPYFLNLRFKVVNTIILSASIIFMTSNFFRTDRDETSYLAVAIALMLFLVLVMNIFLVIKEMYQLKETRFKKRNGLKLIYVIFAFLTLIGTVLISYAHIYNNVFYNNPMDFSMVSHQSFSAFYYSCTTYFTVGYGDITPVGKLARTVSISQMVFGYIITCLVIPTVLVAFQKLFESETH